MFLLRVMPASRVQIGNWQARRRRNARLRRDPERSPAPTVRQVDRRHPFPQGCAHARAPVRGQLHAPSWMRSRILGLFHGGRGIGWREGIAGVHDRQRPLYVNHAAILHCHVQNTPSGVASERALFRADLKPAAELLRPQGNSRVGRPQSRDPARDPSPRPAPCYAESGVISSLENCGY